MNLRPKIMGGVLGALRAASDSFPEPLPNRIKVAIVERQRPQLARSTTQAVEYVIRQNDPERLRAFLVKLTRAERLAIKRHFESKK